MYKRQAEPHRGCREFGVDMVSFYTNADKNVDSAMRRLSMKTMSLQPRTTTNLPGADQNSSPQAGELFAASKKGFRLASTSFSRLIFAPLLKFPHGPTLSGTSPRLQRRNWTKTQSKFSRTNTLCKKSTLCECHWETGPCLMSSSADVQ